MITKRLFVSLCTVVLIVTGTGVSLAASNVIQVKCVDQNGAPINKVEVYIQGIGTTDEKDEKTNKEGLAVFNKLDDDMYRIWARVQGFTPTYHEFLNLSGGSTETITLSFEPGDSTQKLYFEDPALMQQATRLLEEGIQAMDAGQLEVGEQKIKESLAIQPSNPLAHHNLAVLYVQSNQWDLAKTSLEEELAMLDAVIAFAKNDAGGLIQQKTLAEDLLKSLPMRQVATEADQAMKTQQYDLAVEKLNEMLAFSEDDHRIYFYRAMALSQLDRMDEALQDIGKAVELEPGEDTYKSFQANLEAKIATEERDRAKNAVLELQKLNKEGKNEEVLAKFDGVEAMATEDLQGPLWAAKANAHLALEQYPEAFAALEKLWTVDKKPLEQGFFGLGQQLAKRGKQQEARSAYEKALEANPDFAEAHYELGMIYFYDDDDKVNARKSLEKYVEIGEDEAHVSNATSVLAVMDK
ncbi:MAG TPA: tetratricopeptide repeat protein [Acidobacteriota bacterium]|nr:tetratricopeptide repeat protein [Acidobacteriota bacterium]